MQTNAASESISPPHAQSYVVPRWGSGPVLEGVWGGVRFVLRGGGRVFDGLREPLPKPSSEVAAKKTIKASELPVYIITGSVIDVQIPQHSKHLQRHFFSKGHAWILRSFHPIIFGIACLTPN